MQIKRFEVGYLRTNCYVITEDKYDFAVLIDVGGGYDKINEYLNSINKKPKYILLTHGHFDHILDLSKWLNNDGVEVFIHKKDAEMLEGKNNLAKEFGLNVPCVYHYNTVEDGERINCGFCVFTAMHTPGHTPGSSCFITGNYIFSGDTLFYHSFGNTGFPGGNFEDMSSSLKKLLSISGDKTVYPGHGEETTLVEERAFNKVWKE